MNKKTFIIIISSIIAFIICVSVIFGFALLKDKIPVSEDTGIFAVGRQNANENSESENLNESSDNTKTSVADNSSKEESSADTATKTSHVSQSEIDKASKAFENRYYYKNMDSNLHRLYSEIYICITNFDKDFVISTDNDKELDYAFTCVISDNPEIYYVNGYSYVTYYIDDKVDYIEITPAYDFTKEEKNAFDKKIEAYTNAFLSGITSDASDYDKIKYTYDFLIINTEYSDSSKYDFSMASVINENKGNCGSYSQCFQYLLSLLDVESTVVYGKDSEQYAHMFNLVKCDGAYYYTDVTWGDDDDAKVPVIQSGLHYDYMNITTEEVLREHEIDSLVEFPYCVSVKDNYYYRENLYVDEYDEDRIKGIIDDAIANNKSGVAIKFSDAQVMEKVYNMLLYTGRIYNYIEDDDKQVYSLINDDIYVLELIWDK